MYPSVEALKQILLKESYVSEADSQAAEAAGKDSASYIDYLIRHELLTKSLLGQAVAESYKVPFADLAINQVGREQVLTIPEAVAHSLRVVFVKASDQVAVVATDQPAEVDGRKLAPLFKHKKVQVVYTLPEYVEAAFSLYAQPLGTRFSRIVAEGKRVAPELVDEIIKDALSFRASDIHLEPQASGVVVRFRVDGSLHEAGRVPTEYYENILNRIKVESGMRIDEHYAAQDGAIQRVDGQTVTDLRVSLIPTVEGEKVVMRVLGSYVQSFSLGDLGLGEAHRRQFDAAAAKPFGMILTTGPTGSGKTTTLYALLKLLNRPEVNITTIEDPVEYKVVGANQIQVRESTGTTFAKGLRAIVRQDPDIILVGEIRDKETAEISVNAALTGHLLLSTFHANDAATVIPRLIDLGIEPFLLASTLEIVIAQRLARRICNNCRYTVSAADALKDVQQAEVVRPFFASGDVLYVGKGCTVCNGSGFQGRVGLFEIIEVTPEMQELVMTSPSAQAVERLARRQGVRSMFEDGVTKVKSGLTTVAEVLRVVSPPAVAKDAADGKR